MGRIGQKVYSPNASGQKKSKVKDELERYKRGRSLNLGEVWRWEISKSEYLVSDDLGNWVNAMVNNKKSRGMNFGEKIMNSVMYALIVEYH